MFRSAAARTGRLRLVSSFESAFAWGLLSSIIVMLSSDRSLRSAEQFSKLGDEELSLEVVEQLCKLSL